MARKIQPSKVQGDQAAKYQARINELRQSLARLIATFQFMQTEEGQKIDFIPALKACEKINTKSIKFSCSIEDEGAKLAHKSGSIIWKVDAQDAYRDATDQDTKNAADYIVKTFGRNNDNFKPMYNIYQIARIYEAIAEMDPKSDREISEAEFEYVWKDVAPSDYARIFSNVDLSANTKTPKKQEEKKADSNWTSFAAWKSWITKKLNPEQESNKDTNEDSTTKSDDASTEKTLISLDIDTQYQTIADIYVTEGKFYCYAAAVNQPTKLVPKFLSLCDTAFPMATAIDETIQTALNSALLRHNKIEHGDNDNLLLTAGEATVALPSADEL